MALTVSGVISCSRPATPRHNIPIPRGRQAPGPPTRQPSRQSQIRGRRTLCQVGWAPRMCREIGQGCSPGVRRASSRLPLWTPGYPRERSRQRVIGRAQARPVSPHTRCIDASTRLLPRAREVGSSLAQTKYAGGMPRVALRRRDRKQAGPDHLDANWIKCNQLQPARNPVHNDRRSDGAGGPQYHPKSPTSNPEARAAGAYAKSGRAPWARRYQSGMSASLEVTPPPVLKPQPTPGRVPDGK